MIDTFLAKVTYVAPAAYDAQGHLRTEATIKLDVYATKNSTAATPLTLTNGEDAYPYAVGDYVLLNAFTLPTNDSKVSGAVAYTGTEGTDYYGEIVAKAESFTGAQSVIYWNNEQHNVAGTVYDDAVKFCLDQAAQKDAKYTWYFDSYNNLIGAVEIAAANSYGVINSIWWAGNATDGSGVAKANVTYVDGTTAVVDLSEMTYFDTAVRTGKVTHSTGINNKVMKADGGYFYVDSYINTNTNADTNKLLNGHLFRFTTKSNGTLKAVEVDNYPAVANVADYSKLHSIASLAVYKNTQIYTAPSTLVVNANTVFLVRSGAGTSASPYTFKTVTGFTNIDNYVAAEVDWVDLNGDNVADYVYVIGATTTSKVTSLFYFDGQQGAYTLSDGTWVVKGYVDGVAGEVKFADYDALQNTLRDAYQSNIKHAPAANKLYVVKLEDGVVKDGHMVSANGPMVAYDADYPLSAAYESGKNYYVDFVSGEKNATTGANVDTFNGSLYYDASAGQYYSVITEGAVTKMVGTMGNPGDQEYYFVYVTGGAAENRLCVQAYAYDKVTSPSNPDAGANGVVTYTLNIVDNKTGKVLQSYSKTVSNVADGTYTITLAEMAALWNVSTAKLTAFGPDSAAYTLASTATPAVTTASATLNAYYAD